MTSGNQSSERKFQRLCSFFRRLFCSRQRTHIQTPQRPIEEARQDLIFTNTGQITERAPYEPKTTKIPFKPYTPAKRGKQQGSTARSSTYLVPGPDEEGGLFDDVWSTWSLKHPVSTEVCVSHVSTNVSPLSRRSSRRSGLFYTYVVLTHSQKLATKRLIFLRTQTQFNSSRIKFKVN